MLAGTHFNPVDPGACLFGYAHLRQTLKTTRKEAKRTYNTDELITVDNCKIVFTFITVIPARDPKQCVCVTFGITRFLSNWIFV